MKKAFVFCFFIWVSFCNASEIVLIPKEVFVGDKALLTFGLEHIRLPLDTVIAIDVSDLNSVNERGLEDVLIESIMVRSTQSGVLVELSFTPWKTGKIDMPGFMLGAEHIKVPSVEVSSILEKTGKTGIEPARSPLLVPGTIWFVYGGLALFVFVLIVFGVFIRRINRWISNSSIKGVPRKVVRFRKKLLAKGLRLLEKKAGTEEKTLWYGRLFDLARCWCASFCLQDCKVFKSFTQTEVLAQCVHCYPKENIFDEDFFYFFTELDRCRFSLHVGSDTGTDTETEFRLSWCLRLKNITEKIEKNFASAELKEADK